MNRRARQEETENFISLWFQEESLWNIFSDKYKNRDERENSFKRISEVVNMNSKFYFVF